jgi:hypothetical protein
MSHALKKTKKVFISNFRDDFKTIDESRKLVFILNSSGGEPF